MESNDANYQGISINDIPRRALKKLYNDKLGYYTVFLYQIRSFPKNQRPLFIGTGTLVSSSGKKYILTAQHVWSDDLTRKECLAKGDYIGIFWGDGLPLYKINRRYVKPIVIGKPKSAEWGPDLTLLPLGTPDISNLEAKKSFYNLDKAKADLRKSPPPWDRGLWFAMGVPDVLSKKTPTSEEIAGRLYGSMLKDPPQKINGFDYFDFRIDYTNKPSMPSSFGGMSGGSLWHVTVDINKSTGQFSCFSDCYLAGVIYYQEFEKPPNVGIIRCHGHDSIYERALAALEPVA